MISSFPSFLPFQSLVDIVNKIKVMSHGTKPGLNIKRNSAVTSGQGGLSGAEKPFDAMNNIVANLLLNITRYSITVCSYTVEARVLRKNINTLLTNFLVHKIAIINVLVSILFIITVSKASLGFHLQSPVCFNFGPLSQPTLEHKTLTRDVKAFQVFIAWRYLIIKSVCDRVPQGLESRPGDLVLSHKST